MKKSYPKLVLNALFLLVLGLVAIPSINTNLFGREIKFDGINREGYCFKSEKVEGSEEVKNSYCIPKFNFKNSRVFEKQTVVRLTFLDLNSSDQIPAENRVQIFNRNIEILKKRLELIELPDYSVQVEQTDDGKYFVDVYLPFDETGMYNGLVSTLAASGKITVYEDIPDFKPVEKAENDTNFNFLDGKKESEYLSVKDIKRVSKPYFDSRILNGKGGFVIDVDFGNENTEKVMNSAKGTYTAKEVLFPGIIFVQNQIPVGLQAVYIPPIQKGYKGQSNVIVSVLGDNFNQLRMRAVYSMMKTEEIDTTIQIAGTYETSGTKGKEQVEYIKIAFVIAILGLMIVTTLSKKKQGLIWSACVVASLLFGISFSQLGIFTVHLNDGIIFGSFIGVLLTGIMTSRVLFMKQTDFESEYEIIRKNFWVVAPIVLFITVSFAILVSSNTILNIVFGFLIFLVSLLYVVEVLLKTLLPFIFVRSKK